MKYILIVIVLLNVFLSGCKKDPAGPDGSPGRRDYTWTVDTVSIPGTLRKMWGSSSNDIWAVTAAAYFDSTIYHYNGIKWSCYNKNRALDPRAVFGFTNDNVWIVGMDGGIWHFKGSVWNQFATLNYSPDTSIVWQGIWGRATNDIYAVGAFLDEDLLYNKGVIAHYNGTKWELIKSLTKNSSSNRILYSEINKKYYLNGYSFSDMQDSCFLYQWEGNFMEKIYAGGKNYNELANIYLVGNDVLFSRGKKISFYNGMTFEDIVIVEDPNYSGGFLGRSSNDIFLIMKDGIAHYNGYDIQNIYRFSSKVLRFEPILLDNMILLPVKDITTGLTLFIKGVLKK